MYFLRNFFSHVLAIIFFISVLVLSGTYAIKELITHNNIYYALNEIDYQDTIKSNFKDLDIEISDNIIEYIKINDLINHYISDKFLFEFNLIKNNPQVDIKELNNRLAEGIELYIDEKIYEYSGGLSSFLEQNGLDLGLKEQIEDYISNNTSINLSNNEIIKEKDLEKIYNEIDKKFADLKEDTYILEIINIVYNKNLPIILLIIIFVTFTLISLTNFNVLTGVLYTIAPLAITTIIYLIGYYALDKVNFTGGIEAPALNYLTKDASSISLIYFIFFILLTALSIFIYYIGKHINILISHKTGKTTLDTIFDDYDSEGVVKKIQEQEETKEEN